MGTVIKTSLADDPDVFEVMGMMGLAALAEDGLPADLIILTLSNKDGNDEAPTVSTIEVDYCANEGEFTLTAQAKVSHLFIHDCQMHGDLQGLTLIINV